MLPNDFNEAQRRHLLQTLKGGWAFVPPQLPPQFNLGEVALNLASAQVAVGELKGAARRLQNPSMLFVPLIRREALTSSAIEGTITTLDNLLIEEVGGQVPIDDDARETQNYVRALNEATRSLQELPISHRIIKQAHKTLLSGLSPKRGAGKRPGDYRNNQNAIGKYGDDELTARYVPPPPQKALDAMDALEVFINREDRRPGEELIDIALAHYQFEAIHPFNDGNGRIGRMLVTLMAQQLLFSMQPLLHISANLERKKDEYIERLYSVSTQGHWVDWINFFLTTVQESCVSATAVVDQILNLQSEMRDKALTSGGGHRLMTIVDSLFTREYTTVAEIQKLCNVTFPTAKSDIEKLVKLGMLRPLGRMRPTIYVALNIYNLGNR